MYIQFILSAAEAPGYYLSCIKEVFKHLNSFFLSKSSIKKIQKNKRTVRLFGGVQIKRSLCSPMRN